MPGVRALLRATSPFCASEPGFSSLPGPLSGAPRAFAAVSGFAAEAPGRVPAKTFRPA